MSGTPGGIAPQTSSLGSSASLVQATLDQWRNAGNVRKLWDGDTTLWTKDEENQWLGWLNVVNEQLQHPEKFAQIAQEARTGAFRHAIVLGMGGSSLCPDVLHRTFGPVAGFPELLVLDSTVPAQVRSFAQKINPGQTLFLVSSKSGTTTEPNMFKQYFMELAQKAVGAAEAPRRFLAITDPGTALEKLARSEGFRHVFHGVPSIGGRYSALSDFGMIPGAILGMDIPDFLKRAAVMVEACGPSVAPHDNPGVVLGAILGTLANSGRDKVTLVASPGIHTLGAWLEQLMAESTGKIGKGLIPVDDEPLGSPEVYGNDRIFVYERLESDASTEQDAALSALEKAGQPVVRIALQDKRDLGQEFFRWEIATAVAGSILGINAFNQPDVEASKIATRRLTSAYEKTGELPQETPIAEGSGLKLFANEENAKALGTSSQPEPLLSAHLARIKAGDYFAINAYVEMNEQNHATLQQIRLVVRNARHVATTLGFGPRFLHSTGQLHKGGPNSGVFLQITSDDAEDLAIPGQKSSFGKLKQFQAQGDLEVLNERHRRVLRVHLGADVHAGLETLLRMITQALG